MIINHTYKFIFVHIPKAAGTSVTEALTVLNSWADQEIGGTVFGEEVQNAYSVRFGLRKHAHAERIRAVVGNILWDRYFTFTFVRHPLGRLQSVYNFLREWTDGNPLRDRMLEFSSFDDFVLSGILESPDGGPDQIFVPQSQRLTDLSSGKLLVNFVGKVETLGPDMAKIMSILKIPAHLIRPVGRHNVTKDAESVKPNPEALKIIKSKYRSDYEMFKYAP